MPLLDNLLSVIAPHNCLVCGVEGQLVCRLCAFDAFPQLPSRCYRCKALTSDYAVCDNCRTNTSLKRVWIKTSYENTAKDLIHFFKFERARSATSVIVESLDEFLPYFVEQILVVPVPTATERIRQRGYDQAALLAKALAERRNLEYLPALARLTHTRQVGASRKQRFEQLQLAFSVTKSQAIKDREILLIDDVITTGATLETLARLLKKAGAKSVMAATFAQKL